MHERLVERAHRARTLLGSLRDCWSVSLSLSCARVIVASAQRHSQRSVQKRVARSTRTHTRSSCIKVGEHGLIRIATSAWTEGATCQGAQVHGADTQHARARATSPRVPARSACAQRPAREQFAAAQDDTSGFNTPHQDRRGAAHHQISAARGRRTAAAAAAARPRPTGGARTALSPP